MNVQQEVQRAYERIRPHVRETILEYSPFYSKLGKANVYFKLENLQHTGSFKVRGATNKLLSLTEAERARGIVTTSSGNHGAATAYSSGKLNTSVIVFVNNEADPSKVEAIERLGVEVRHFGEDLVDTEAHARQYAAEHGLTYLPPYNDPQVVGGQGTIGVELTRQLDQIDAVFISVGGGGLIGGIAGYLKSINPGVQIIGGTPQNSQVMAQSVKEGRLLELPSLPTLSDGTAGGVEADSITFELCRTFVDEFVTVTEDEIKAELRQFMGIHPMLIEGAAAVSIVAYLKMGTRFAGKNVVIVICGANISLKTLKRVLDD